MLALLRSAWFALVGREPPLYPRALRWQRPEAPAPAGAPRMRLHFEAPEAPAGFPALACGVAL